jgi:predicted ester cyclase
MTHFLHQKKKSKRRYKMKKLLLILPLALALCFPFACQDTGALDELEAINAQAEIEAQNKELTYKFVKALDEGNFDIHEELLTEDYISHFAGSPETLSRDVQKQNIQVYYEIFPDNTHTILDIIAEGDKVAFRQVNRTTHSKEFEGLAPTGKQIEYEGMWIFRFKDGKIVESWGVEDFLTFFMQVGMELKPKQIEK